MSTTVAPGLVEAPRAERREDGAGGAAPAAAAPETLGLEGRAPGRRAGPVVLRPAADFRAQVLARGGRDAARCFQCATCSAVCKLSSADAVFPRRQMLLAQWGLGGELERDPAIWLCHQCNDCTARCPRDARPGDTLQAVRAVLIERWAPPRLAGRLVAAAGRTWPLLVGAPILLWALLIAAVTGFRVPRLPLVYHDVVPHELIYAVFFPAVALVVLAALLGARRAWTLWGERQPRAGSLVSAPVSVVREISLHRRFAECETSRARLVGHFPLAWGFAGAAATTALVAIAMHGFGMALPVPQWNPIKLLGNGSALLLVGGSVLLVANRVRASDGARSTAFDTFFLGLVVAVVFTGAGTELARFFLPPAVALGIYVAHLGLVLALFATFPYSKLAHLLYRTLAMVHEEMARRAASRKPDPV